MVPHFEKHDKDDDGYLSKSDLENMTGVWGDVLIDRQATDDEDERPKKQIKLKESASFRSRSHFSCKFETGEYSTYSVISIKPRQSLDER